MNLTLTQHISRISIPSLQTWANTDSLCTYENKQGLRLLGIPSTVNTLNIQSSTVDPATLFKHLLNLHVFPAMSTAPNHPTGNTTPASRQRCNESNRIEKGMQGTFITEVSPPSFSRMKGLIERRNEKAMLPCRLPHHQPHRWKSPN